MPVHYFISHEDTQVDVANGMARTGKTSPTETLTSVPDDINPDPT